MLVSLLAAVAIGAPQRLPSPVPVERTVSQIVGAPVSCFPTLRDWNVADGSSPDQQWWLGIAGFYDFRSGKAGLTPNTCTALGRVGHGYLTLTQALAVFTVAHEWGHVRNGPDETQADCFGARHMPQVAYLFGLRGRESYYELRVLVRDYAGYAPIPSACFVS